jgi:hypothetical protein
MTLKSLLMTHSMQSFSYTCAILLSSISFCSATCQDALWTASSITEYKFPAASTYNSWGISSKKNVQSTDIQSQKLGSSYYAFSFINSFSTKCSWSQQVADFLTTDTLTGLFTNTKKNIFSIVQDSGKLYISSNSYTNLGQWSKLVRWVDKSSDTSGNGMTQVSGQVSFNGPILGAKLNSDTLFAWYGSMVLRESLTVNTIQNRLINQAINRDSAALVAQLQNALSNTQLASKYSTEARLYKIAYLPQIITATTRKPLNTTKFKISGREISFEKSESATTIKIFTTQGEFLEKVAINPRTLNWIFPEAYRGFYIIEVKNNSKNQSFRIFLK